MIQGADRISLVVAIEDYRALREFNEPDDPIDEEDDDLEGGEDELGAFAREPARHQLTRRNA